MRTPKTFSQWVRQEGTIEELAVKAILTDKIIRALSQSSVEQLLISQMLPVIARGLIKLGRRPSNELIIESERDASLRADEYVALMETIQGKLPIEYLSLAYNAWQQNYLTIKEWEHKSLSAYLQWWLFGGKRPKKQIKMVEILLDKIDPLWRN